MREFNLPPGVRVSDLPGNRPEEIAWERAWERIESHDQRDILRALAEDDPVALRVADDLAQRNYFCETAEDVHALADAADWVRRRSEEEDAIRRALRAWLHAVGDLRRKDGKLALGSLHDLPGFEFTTNELYELARKVTL